MKITDRFTEIILLLLLSAFLMGYVSFTYPNGNNKSTRQNDKPYEVKEFNVTSPVRLDVRTSGGYIKVESRYSDKVRVEMFVRKGNRYLTPKSNALKGFSIDISQNGNEIRAIARHHGSFGFSFGNQPSISFVLYTPKSVNGELHTSGGKISIKGLNGDLNTYTSGGRIEAADLEGNYTLKTSGGRIVIHQIKGTINASTSGGRIVAGNANGKLLLHTSGGSISLNNVGGEINASTSGGNISASVNQISNLLSLKTSGGNITATIPSNQGYTLELRGGSVHTNLQNFNGTMRRNKVDGTVRGGGPKIILKTSGGSIRLSD